MVKTIKSKTTHIAQPETIFQLNGMHEEVRATFASWVGTLIATKEFEWVTGPMDSGEFRGLQDHASKVATRVANNLLSEPDYYEVEVKGIHTGDIKEATLKISNKAVPFDTKSEARAFEEAAELMHQSTFENITEHVEEVTANYATTQAMFAIVQSDFDIAKRALLG